MNADYAYSFDAVTYQPTGEYDIRAIFWKNDGGAQPGAMTDYNPVFVKVQNPTLANIHAALSAALTRAIAANGLDVQGAKNVKYLENGNPLPGAPG